MKKDDALVIVNKLKALHFFDELDYFHKSYIDVSEELKTSMIDEFSSKLMRCKAPILAEFGERSDLMKVIVEEGIVFVQRLYKNFVQIEPDSFSMMIKSVSDQITEQLIRITDSQLIQPWSTLAVSSLTDSISKRLQLYLVDREQNSDSHNKDQKKYEDILKKEERTPKEIAFIASYSKYRMFAEQINYNSWDYRDAYLQCEIIHFAGKSDDKPSEGPIDINVQKAADDVINGGPANIAIMITTAKKNGMNLKIVDDRNYARTPEDIKNGVQVIYIEHDPDNKAGHAFYMDNYGQFVEANSTGNDCFFAAFSQLLKNIKSIKELRNDAAEQMESNSKNFSKVLADENRINKSRPGSSCAWLFTAGARKNQTARNEEDDADGLSQVIVLQLPR